MIVIGLTGRARSGKDTVADYLVEKHGFKKLSFAGPLKQVALAADPYLGMDVRHPGHLIRLSEALEYLTEDQVKALYPEYRRFLQKLGTEGVRAIDPAFWIKAATRRIDGAHSSARFVFTDTRFMNECQAIWRDMRRHDSVNEVWHVNRPSLPPLESDAHPSEREAGNFGEDRVLNNTADIEKLTYEAYEALGEVLYAEQVRSAA